MRTKKKELGRKKVVVFIILGVVVLAIIFWRGNLYPGAKKGVISSDKKAVVTGDQGVAEGINIKVSAPNVNGTVTSPLKIAGEAKGWYFEGSFPVKLLDEKGAILATGMAKAKGDWQVDAYVPFVVELKFDAKGAKKGDIIFEKSNPSGLPQNAGSFSFAVLLGE
ncbi:MAG: Gmad2 immunoglobulin-like domain-containing protein [Parcubacteria group bacterium]|jgi:hypothetical protein